MICKECHLEMKVIQTQTLENSNKQQTVWECLNGHKYVSEDDPPFPYNLERKNAL